MKQEPEQNFLELAPLFSGEVSELPFDLRFSTDLEENQIRAEEIRFFGTLRAVGEDVWLNGTASCALSALCGRCLAPVEKEISAELELPVLREASETETEHILCEGDKIDLQSPAEETLLMAFPFRLLCKEDCKGLCPKCGKDLNEGPCSCKREIDPRLAGLANYFENENIGEINHGSTEEKNIESKKK